MLWLVAIILIILAGGVLYLAKARVSAPLFLGLLIASLGVIGAVLLDMSVLKHRIDHPADYISNRPLKAPGDGYVSSDGCRSCHPAQYHTWWHTYHRTMTQLATSEAIKQPFQGEFVHNQRRYTLEQSNDEFYIQESAQAPDETDTEVNRYKVVMTTGSHHFQVYWYEAGDGRGRVLNQFPFVYLIDEQQWIPRNASFLNPSENFSSNEHGRWNTNCIKCHATRGRPKPVVDNQGAFLKFDTDVAEFGIACESCHGPGDSHVEYYKNPVNRLIAHWSEDAALHIVNPAKLPAKLSTDICGQCHSVSLPWTDAQEMRWRAEGVLFRPGHSLGDYRKVVEKVDPGQDSAFEIEKWMSEKGSVFWPDGMMRLAGREYHGVKASPCFQSGNFSCLSCHDLHKKTNKSVNVKAWADKLLHETAKTTESCTQCHTELVENEQFAVHAKHQAEFSQGCYGCHMPYTSYGLMKSIRTHQITKPNLVEDFEKGRPSACNLCHLNRTIAWTDRILGRDFSQASIDVGAIDPVLQDVAWGAAMALKGDAAIRALIYDHMGKPEVQLASGQDWMAPYLAVGLMDDYLVNRQIAYRSLKTLAGFSDFVFDFQASEEIRQKDRDRVVEIWESLYSSGENKVLLIREHGIDERRMGEILMQRDNAPVYLAE